MLNPSECFAASISAAKAMTLVLPRADREHRCLIVMNGETPIAICLDKVQQLGPFMAFECADNDIWKGLHIPGVRIELDEASLHDADGSFAPRGSMVRYEDKLALRVQFKGKYQTSSSGVVIIDGLPACALHTSACFLKWQIVLGEGEEKRVMAGIDATPSTS